eukprot:11856178-Karenia_brevis.AAC.1
MEKAKRLSSSDAEIKVPREVVEEARGSSSSSPLKPKSSKEIKKARGDEGRKWTEMPGATECTEGVGGIRNYTDDGD